MPENVARLSETFSKAYDLMDLDKKVVLGKKSTLITFFPLFIEPAFTKIVFNPNQYALSPGLSQPLLENYDTPVLRTNLERMQGFFTSLYDNW